jgi:TPR repeat protein
MMSNGSARFMAGKGPGEVPPDQILRHVAEAADADGLFACARRLEKQTGKGTNEALQWYRKSAAMGHKDAKAAAKRLSTVAE